MAGRDTGDGGKSGLSAAVIVPIIVALISLTGVITTALLTNWDKIFGRSAVAAAPQPTPADAAALPAGVGAIPVDKDAAQKLSDSQKNAYGAATTALDDVTRQIQDASQPASAPNVTGVWADPDGYSFNVRQSGSTLSYQEYANGLRVGQGAGQINGRDLRYSFATSEDRGECTGRLSVDGTEISGKCTSIDGNSWPFTVARQN